MVKAAGQTIEMHEHRQKRRRAVQQKPEIYGSPAGDHYAEEIMRQLYSRHFGNMVNAFNELSAIDDTKGIIPNRRIHLDRPNPHQILRIGKAASRTAINYADQIRAS